jgi:hypothetical protein
MNNGLQTIATRGRIVFGLCLIMAVVPWVLELWGVVDSRGRNMPLLDLSLSYRACLVTKWLVISCLLCWAAAQFRVRYGNLFEDPGRGIVSSVIGVIGAMLFAANAVQWSAQPYTRSAYGTLEGWQYTLYGLLLVWSFVFGWRRQSPLATVR